MFWGYIIVYSQVTFVTWSKQVDKIEINFCWCFIEQAAMWPEVIIPKPKSLKVIIAEFHFIIHSPEQPFYFAVGCWAVDFGSDMLNSSSFAPFIKAAVLAIQSISTAVVR